MRLLFAVVVALLLAVPPGVARVFDSENLHSPGGYPALAHFVKGAPDKPLIVLAAGSGNTGRIFYGPHDGADPDQFLATHLNALGFNVLSVSIPLATGDPIFAASYPAFSIRDWGRTLALVAGIYVDRHGLSPNVLLAGWSMAGKAAQSMASQAHQAGLTVDMFISLAATPPILGVLPVADDLTLNPQTGYGAAPDPAFKGFLWNIRQNARREGIGAIIAGDALLAHYVGEGPVGLSHTGIRYDNGAATIDILADIEDGQGYDFAGFPLVATIIPDGRHDLRHSVSDRHAWGLVTTTMLYRRWIAPNLKPLRKLSGAQMNDLIDLIETAPDRLSRKVAGNHFFFVGKTGAQATAQAISALHRDAGLVQAELQTILKMAVEAAPSH